MTTKTPAEAVKPIPFYKGKHPLLGGLPEYQKDPLAFMKNAMMDYGPIVRSRFAYLTFYFISHPAYIRHVLQQNYRNYVREKRFARIMKGWVKDNLFASEGAVWLRKRRIMQPAFHRRQVNQFGGMIVAETEALLDEWSHLSANQAIEIQETMMHLSLKIISKAMFNLEMGENEKALQQALTIVSGHTMYRNVNVFAPPLFVPTKRNKAFKEALDLIIAKVQRIIDERHQTDSPTYDLLDMLLAARDEEDGSRLSDSQLIREMQGIFFAGHETTALTLAWTWHLLAQHPHVEETLLTELKTVLAGRSPTIDDLANLPYTKQVIQESMRFYPPVWGTSREALEDDYIDGYFIPKGSKLSLNIYTLHHHPDYWDEPETFDPDRFSPERVAERDRYIFLPFGEGPRKCIGAPLAMAEAQLILATIAQRYHLRPARNQAVVPVPEFTLKIKNGLLMIPEAR